MRKRLQRRQGQGRVQDALKVDDLVETMKQLQNFTLAFRVLDLNACGLVGLSDANLGVVDMLGYPTEVDSEPVKVYSLSGDGILPVRNQWLMNLGRFNVLRCGSKRSPEYAV